MRRKSRGKKSKKSKKSDSPYKHNGGRSNGSKKKEKKKISSYRKELKKLRSEEVELDKQIAELRRVVSEEDEERIINELHEYNDMKNIANTIITIHCKLDRSTYSELCKRFDMPPLD